MKQWNMKASALAALLAAMTLAGCDAQGGKDLDDGLDGNGDTVLFPNEGNDPNTTTTINEGTTPLTGNFICEGGIRALTTGATTEVAANGLVGSLLTPLLNLLGADTVTQLLNSVSEPDNVIDNKLQTFATYSLTLGLLAIIDSVDLLVVADQSIQPGNFAVFAVRFPKATLELSLLNSVTVSTFLGETAQESITYSKSDLDLLGVGAEAKLFIGVKATKAFDTASISLTPAVLSANVGEAMYVHELCTKGRFVTPPTP